MDGRFLISTYRPNVAISYFDRLPTFGHTTVITTLFSDYSTESLLDYIQGLLFIPGLCLALLIVWIVILLSFKCLGRKAGVLAGYPYSQETDSRIPKTRCGPVFVSVTALAVACLGVMFLVRGTETTQAIFNDIRYSAIGLKEVEDLAISSMDKAIQLGDSSLPLREHLISLIDGGICNPPEGSDFQDIANLINTQAQVVLDSLIALQDFPKNELKSIQSYFKYFEGFSNDLAKAADIGEKYSNPMYVAAPIVTFGLIFGIGGLLAWSISGCDTYFCIQTWAFLPIFFLMVLVAAILTAGSSVVLKVSAGMLLLCNSVHILSSSNKWNSSCTFGFIWKDICLGGETKNPEGTVKVLLEAQDLDYVALLAANYYIISVSKWYVRERLDLP